MEDWLTVHSQAYSKVYFLYGLVFTINIGALVVLSFNYCKSTYSLELLEENDPDIDLTGLKGFSFESYSNMEYYPEMSNLGTTGKLFMDCFTGKCEYKETYTCYKESCTGTGKNKKCHEYKTKCTRYFTNKEYSCSADCRATQYSYCSSCPHIYGATYRSSSCSRDKDTKKIDNATQSCNADNLVMFWNHSYYRRSNRTDYKRFTYLNSAVTANESCPTGKKVCGVLDNLGNKFCYPQFEDCPINYITLDTSNSSYNYGSAQIGNKVIYYTNQADENSRIVGGLFVDSDLLIKYNNEDCEILDESSVLDLLNGHYNKLYRESLSYDPYKSYTKEVQQGKSYLKWCVPGVGREKNISKIKELNVVYHFNVTTNKKVITPIKNMFTASYFVALPGFIGMFFLLIVILLSFFEQNNIHSYIGDFLRCSAINFIFLICIGVNCILFIVSSILMISNNGNLSTATKLDLDVAIFKSLKLMNYIGLGICIGLVVLIAIFVLYLFITPTTYIESPKQSDSYHPYKDTYSSSNKAETKTEDFKTSSDFNNIPTNTNNNNDNNYNSSSDFNNNTNTGYNPDNFNNNTNTGYNPNNFNNNNIYINPSNINYNPNTAYNSNTDFNNNNYNNAGGYSSADFPGYSGGGNIYSQPLNPSQQQSVY